MSVWEALVFSISLITSNLLILNGIAKFDLKGRPLFYLPPDGLRHIDRVRSAPLCYDHSV